MKTPIESLNVDRALQTSGVTDLRFRRNDSYTFSLAPIAALIILCSIADTAFARKIYSSGTGNWTSTSTWAGGIVPVAGDTVIIQNTHTVSVSSNLYSNSTYMFLVILGSLDLSNNGKMSFNSSSKVIIETNGRLIGNGNSDQLSIGTGPSEYTGNLGTITGPSYVSNGHTPVSGEGTTGCGCYTSIGNCTITSTTGYQVHIMLWATSIVVRTSPCTNGYNYDVNLSYNVTFTGTNIPSNLDNLNGNIFCGSNASFFALPTSGGSGTLTTNAWQWRPINDCAAATPQLLNCLNASINVSGPGIPNTSCSASLPIELLSFEAQAVLQGAKLTWITTMEKDFDYFQIERAAQDLNFVPISKIPGKGGIDINVAYSYVDSEVKTGKNYYRLKSVDHDGTFAYSKVVLVDWMTAGGIKLYPNPLTDHKFTIDLNDYLDSPADLQLLNQVGQTVYHSEAIDSKSEIQLPTSIESGFYYIKISSGRHQEIVKVVIQ